MSWSRSSPRPPAERSAASRRTICKEAGRRSTPDPARDAPALATLALLAQNGKGAQTVESAPCGALRESGGSVRCRSCRRHNVEAGVKLNFSGAPRESELLLDGVENY